MSPEVKLYKDLKKNTPNILWNRIENLSLLGMPDLLGYNKKQYFFTVELKVAKGNKIKFSPHQIAVKTLDPSPSKTYSISLFRGSSINALVRDGVKTEPIACGFLACSSIFDEIGLTLENLGV
jgi:ribosomal protein L15E